MTVQTTSNLPNALISVYKGVYQTGARIIRLYDQIAVDYTQVGADGKTMEQLQRSNQVVIPFLSDMVPGTNEISETLDVVPQSLTDATKTVTTTSRGEALQWSQKLALTTYTDYTAKAYQKVGENAMETIESLAIAAGLAGTWVERPAGVTRANLDAAVPAHRASESLLRKYDGLMQSLKIPSYITNEGALWLAIMPPFCWHDITESGNVESIGIMQQSSIHLNWELGQIGRFRLLSSPYAKVFGAAGADRASHNVATTLNGAVNALAGSVVTASDVSGDIIYGLQAWIGTEETGSTFYPTNEPVKVVSAAGTTVTVLGQGGNAGLRFAHATATPMRNAYSVYPILLAGPESLVRVYATDTGPYGEVLPPDVSGLLKQWNHIGWKYYGNYNRVTENRLVRIECATSYDE